MRTDRVGLVGLGVLGAPMVGRLVGAGIVPSVFDVRAEAVADAVGAGAVARTSPAEVAADSGATLVCVRTDDQCVEVVEGTDGLLRGARPGHVVALLSTVHPDTVAGLARSAAARDVAVVDTPLAGLGATSVADGSMWAFAGGDDAAVDVVEPALAAFTERVLRSGPLGSGAVLKLAHNVMVYLSYLGAYEAYELARVGGVRDGLIAEVATATGALSRQSAVFLDIHARRRRDGPDDDREFFSAASALLEKDLRHAIAVAREHGLDLPAAALARPLGDVLFHVGSGDVACREPPARAGRDRRRQQP